MADMTDGPQIIEKQNIIKCRATKKLNSIKRESQKSSGRERERRHIQSIYYNQPHLSKNSEQIYKKEQRKNWDKVVQETGKSTHRTSNSATKSILRKQKGKVLFRKYQNLSKKKK